MKYCLFFSLLCFLFSCDTFAQDRAANWEKDIRFLEEELPKRHAGLFRYYSEQAFQAALDSLRTDLLALEDWQVVLRLQEILCRAGDAHTSIYHSEVNNGPVFPLRLHWFKEGLFVMGASSVSGLDTLLGKELLAVNGIPVEEIAARMSRLLVAENEFFIRHRLPKLLPSYYPLRYTGVVGGVSAIFTFRNMNGHTFSLPLKAIPVRSLKAAFVSFKPETYAFTERNNRTPFWHEYLEGEQILYIRYNRCTSREVEQQYGSKKRAKKLPSFEKLEEDVLRILREEPVKKLVADLSNNPGGSSLQGTRLAKKIGQAYQSKVYVIIGRRTFSSAVLNTLDFQKYCGAVLVGEPTSGRPNHFGEVKKFQLPASGATVLYSTKYFQQVDGDPPTIEPDIRAELSFSEFRRGIDPAWEYILAQ